jgi:hypothetical protein
LIENWLTALQFFVLWPSLIQTPVKTPPMPAKLEFIPSIPYTSPALTQSLRHMFVGTNPLANAASPFHLPYCFTPYSF